MAEVPARLAPITRTAEPFVGVTYYQIVQGPDRAQRAILPRPLAIHLVEIDPASPGVTLFAAPGNGDEPHEYARRTTSDFVAAHKLAVAINGDFYSTDTGLVADVLGLGMSAGRIDSPLADNPAFRHALIATKDDRALVVSGSDVPADAWHAVSGNIRLLRDGQVLRSDDPYSRTLNPHTAVGVDADAGRLYFLVVDGRQAGYSEGMLTGEMAELLLEFGVEDAINLDGGGSSTLVFADGPAGAPRTVNSPSDGSSSYAPGHERLVANHFGAFAKPNPAYKPLSAPLRPAAALPEPTLAERTVLENFAAGPGQFDGTPTASGSTRGIAPSSRLVHDPVDGRPDPGCLQLTLIRTATPAALVRLVSGGGEPSRNRVEIEHIPHALPPRGRIACRIKTSDPGLTVAIALDDGAPGATGLERSAPRPIVADGRWRRYEWDLADPEQWSNFSGGNGRLDGPNVYVDSLLLESDRQTSGSTLRLSLDTIEFVPE
ncbi:MAG: phosphodiester glycosidase family protein [Pirellulales bacterium]|nr:phosphodiester glycosidase family protein [Pirellulales bacterium]